MPGIKWGILDPDYPNFHGPYLETFPGPIHEIACSGHSWTIDGRWFVAGGAVPTELRPADLGSSRAWIYDPDVVGLDQNAPHQGAWFEQPPMVKGRYYPTVKLTQIDVDQAPLGELIVAGGSELVDPPYDYNDNYETFRPGPRHYPPDVTKQGTWQQWQPQLPAGRLYAGPTFSNGRFQWYPRLFVLPDGRIVHVGPSEQSSFATHTASSNASWWPLGIRTMGHGGYGAAILYPNLGPAYESTVMNIAGPTGPNSSPRTRVEWCNAAQAGTGFWPNGHDWTGDNTTGPPPPNKPPPLTIARSECTAVILPNGKIMVLGDGSAGTATPELLDGGQWRIMAPEASRRIHHGGAMLLPSGRVLSFAGGWQGSDRNWDFQLYDPEYLVTGGVRPAWAGSPPNGILNRGQQYSLSITMPAGATVGKVVLMRPGSLTHHTDMDQQYVELPFIDDGLFVTITAPSGPPGSAGPGPKAPLGYWMLFLVTNTGTPSVAQFVRFL